MQKCLELAEKGFGRTRSNPMVGCIVVLENGIIASGYHQEYGKAHAEVNAISSLDDKSMLADATVYVNLEPCSHYGKTPPCADFLIQSGVKKVVIACQDPNPKVSGQGIRKLEDAGCEVTVGICEKEARYLNRRFFTFHEKHRPWIILKWAQSADGFIGREGVSQLQISSEESKKLLHKFRAEEMSIMVGTKTALVDNPYLTARGNCSAENPVRIVLDRQLKIPRTHNIFNREAQTIIFSETSSDNYADNIEIVKLDFSRNLEESICRELYARKINSCLIEGGALTLQNWIGKNLYDEARIFVSRQVLHSGVKAPVFDFHQSTKEEVGPDMLYTFNTMFTTAFNPG